MHQELAELAESLSQGKTEALEPLQLQFIPLCKKIATIFIRKVPRQWEDIQSVAFLGMCKALNSILTGEVKDIRSIENWVAKNIIFELRDFLRNDRVIRVPRTATSIPIIVSLSIFVTDAGDEVEWDIEDTSKKVSNIDLEDLLKMCGAKSERDRRIVILALEGHTILEIAGIIKEPRSTVFDRLKRMKKNYKKGSENG